MKLQEKKILLAARQRIDRVDNAIMRSLIERMEMVSVLHAQKRKSGMPIRDKRREAQIIARLQRKFPQVPSGLVAEIYRAIFTLRRKR